jgi:hypothetical protein
MAAYGNAAEPAGRRGAAQGTRPASTSRDQPITTLKAEFDGVITVVGAGAGQNVNAGQMVVNFARPDERTASQPGTALPISTRSSSISAGRC